MNLIKEMTAYMHKAVMQSSPASFDECRTRLKLPQTLRPSKLTGAAHLPVSCYRLHPLSNLNTQMWQRKTKAAQYSLTEISLSVKDTCVDDGEFEAGQVLDAQSDGKCDNGNIETHEKTHEPDDQRYASRRLSKQTRSPATAQRRGGGSRL